MGSKKAGLIRHTKPGQPASAVILLRDTRTLRCDTARNGRLLADLFNEKGALHVGQGLLMGRSQSANSHPGNDHRNKSFVLFRALLNEISTATWLRTLHSECDRFGGLAFRIGGTGEELAEAPGFDDHGTRALFTFSSVVSSNLGTILMVPSGNRSKFCVFLQGGSSLYAGQARNLPFLPHLISINALFAR